MKQKKKILVVEDDVPLAKAVRDKLMRNGYEVVIAEDGDEALKLMEKIKPDLVLLDIILPLRDGFEVLNTIKCNNNYCEIPVIVLSNLAQRKDILRGKKLGATEYLVKSNSSLQLVLERVKRHLPKKKKKK